MKTVRVLMISKACLVGAYQRKLEAIAAHADMDLTVIVPPRWRDERGTLTLERAHTHGYRLLVEPIILSNGFPLDPDSAIAHKLDFHLHFYPRLGRRIAELRPEIVHIDEEPYNFATFHALRLARRHGAKTIFFSWQNLRRRYPFPFGAMERYVLRRADYAICGNRDAVGVWRAKGYRGPVAVIPQFGIDPGTSAPAPHPRDSGRPFVIGYLGRLVEEKGVGVLARACAELEGNWRLEIVGSGPEKAALQRLIGGLGLANRTTFAGWMPSAQVPGYLHHLDAVVLPSVSRPHWIEQFGRVLVEAMACGVPVVGSTSGEIPNVIGDAGLIFPEGNVNALADCLRRLQSAPEMRRRLAIAGRERALTHFTQEKIAAATVAVYRDLMPDD